jgi:hypothetical protein
MTAKVGKIPRDGRGSTPCPCIKAMARNEGFDPKRSLVREKTGNFCDSAVFREHSSRKHLCFNSLRNEFPAACCATEQGINSRQQGINFAITGNEQAVGAKSIRPP